MFYKVQAYAALYKALGKTANEIPGDEITASIFRDIYPRSLFEELDRLGFRAELFAPGVYHIGGRGLFPTQILVGSEMDAEKHLAFKVLSKHAKKEDIRAFILAAEQFQTQGEQELAGRIFQVSTSAQTNVYRSLYEEDEAMSDALMEIMKKDIDQKVEQGVQQGMLNAQLEGIRNLMKNLQIGAQQAMNALGIDPEKQASYMSML